MTLEKIQEEIEKQRQDETILKYVQNIVKASDFKRFNETSEGRLLISLGIKPYIEVLFKYYDSPLRGIPAKDRAWIRLCTVNVEILAFVVISSIMTDINTKGRPLTAVCRRIGNSLKRLMKIEDTKKDDPKLIAYLGDRYKKASAKLREKLTIETIENIKAEEDYSKSPKEIRIGATLLDLFIKSGANIIEKFEAKDKTKMLKLTKDAEYVLVQATNRDYLLSCTNYLPMVCPPKDWKGYKGGGYLTHKVPFIKAYTPIGREVFKNNLPIKVMDVVNKLQKTPFRINTKVLDVISTIYYSNIIDPDTLGNKVPNLIGGLPTSNVVTVDDLLPYTYSKETYCEYKREQEKLLILLESASSKRLQLLLTLDMAKKMREHNQFYYVYQVDYRGRVYSHINFLSPQSPSYSKAMLEFGRGELLNEEGLYWLKIHIANCYGLDKKTFEDRIEWFDKNEPMIKSTGTNPMDSIPIWYNSDSPFEYLAGCIAYVDYTQGKEVHLPIGLDATCSGLQFYSVLLKDNQGAEAVNVKNIYDDNGNILRADVYQQVADRVNELLLLGEYPKEYTFTTSDGEEKTATTKVEANSLKGKITRNLVKRNVMTVPYSVSRRGMYNQLSDEFYDLKSKNKQFWEGDEWICLKLLTDLNYRAIYEVVIGAKEGQRVIKEAVVGLKDVARWKTPIYDFPVLQPSFKTRRLTVDTPLGELVIYQDLPELDKKGQSNAIAPNVIHSLDSTLLYYVIDNFKGDIFTVHDCFFVHPNNGEAVRDCYKKGMVELMERDVLKDIVNQIGFNIELPELGTLTKEDIMEAKYIIS